MADETEAQSWRFLGFDEGIREVGPEEMERLSNARKISQGLKSENISRDRTRPNWQGFIGSSCPVLFSPKTR